MDLRTKALLALFAVTISSALWAWNERDNRLRAEGRAQIEAQRGDSLAVLVVELGGKVEAERERVDSVRTVADSIVAKAEAKVDSIRRHRPAVVDTVVQEAGADSTVVRQAVERVAATYEAEISELQRITAQQAAVISAQESLLATMRVKENTQSALIGSLRAQIEAMGQTRPGWVERNTSKGLLVAGGIVAGFITAEVIR